MSMKRLAAGIAVTWLPMTALAVETSFDGFLTIGAGSVSESGIDYAGYDDDWSFEPDTVSGFQLGANFTDRLSATAQVVIRGSDDFEPELEWAYLSFDVTDSVTVRGGRLRPPFFVVSDFYDVGFAYPWVRPVEEVYMNIPFTHYEGMDIIFNTSIGDWDATIQAYAGGEDGDQEYRGSNVDRKLEDFMGIAFTFDRNALSLRASYHQADVTFDVEDTRPLFDALRGLGFGAVADDVAIIAKPADFVEVAATYDADGWFLRGEATQTDFSRGMVADQQSWYVTGGAYVADFTPYLTYSRVETDPESGYADAIPFGLDPGLDVLRLTVEGIIAGSKTDRAAISVGTRWNVLDNTAIKAEVTFADDKLPTGTDFNVYSLVVNVLF